MKHWTILAALLNAAATAITDAVEGQPAGDTPESAATPAGEDKPRRGRPPGSTNKPAASEPEKPKEEAPTGGKTYEQLRSIIEPLVKDGRQPEVKAIITKYAPDLKTLATLPAKHAEFEKDIDGLSL